MDALGESLTGQKVAKDNLTHIATDLVVAAQHVGQSLGLFTHLAPRFHHQPQLFLERGRLCRMVFGVVIDGFAHLADGVLQGLRDSVHTLTVLFLQPTGLRLHLLLGHVL